MSVIRIVDSTHRAYDDDQVVAVEVLNVNEDTISHWITVPRAHMRTQEDLKLFIENYIREQKTATPDYIGLEWRTDSV